MGCWNGTCMLTHLPIMGGDPVVAFLIEVSSAAASGGAPCYSTDRGAPLTLAIKGVYDDYGSIEKIEPESEALAMSFLNLDKLSAANADEKDAWDRVDFESLQSICSQGAERGNLRVACSYQEKANEAGLALMHRGAFEAAVEAAGKLKDWHSVSARERVEKVLQEGLAKWRSREAKRAKIESESTGEERETRLDALQFEEMLSSMNERGSLFSSSPSGGHVSSASRLGQEKAVLSAAMDEAAREALIETRLFCEALSRARMDWQVSPGAGSQDGSMEVQLAVAKAAAAIAAPRIAEREEEEQADRLAEAARNAGDKP